MEEFKNTNRIFAYYPSDFVHGILAEHCESETGNVAGKSLIKVGDDVVFGEENTLYKYYKEKKNFDLNEFILGWKVIAIFDKEQTGYLGVVYSHDEYKQLVLGHRSTNFKLSLMGNFFKQSGMQLDFDGIARGIKTMHQKDGYEATQYFINMTDQVEYSMYTLSTTGHSLGAWLAEMSVYYAKAERDFHLKGVTFDGPGSLEMMKQLSSSRVKNFNKLKIKYLDIKSYFSAPNIVNCTNKHVGECYRVFPEIEKQNKYIESISTKFGFDALISTLGHDIKYILPYFDPELGKPTNCQRVIKWPSISYKKEKFLDKENNSLISLVKLCFSYIREKIDLQQFWHVHKYLDRQKGYDDSDVTNEETKFELIYGAQYQVDGSKWLVQKSSDMFGQEMCILHEAITKAEYLGLDSDVLTGVKNITKLYKVDKYNKKITVVSDNSNLPLLDINDLRSLVKEFIHRRSEDFQALQDKLIPAYKLLKQYPEIKELAEYLGYFAANHEIPKKVLSELFTQNYVELLEQHTQEILSISDEFIKVPEKVYQHIRKYYDINNKPKIEILSKLVNVVNSFMPDVSEFSNIETFRLAKLYFPHVQSILSYFHDDQLVTNELNSESISNFYTKLGFYYKYIVMDYSKSLKYFKIAYDSNKNLVTEGNLGIAYTKVHQLEEGLKYINQALEKCSDTDILFIARYSHYKGIINCKINRLEDSIEFINIAVIRLEEIQKKEINNVTYVYELLKLYGNLALILIKYDQNAKLLTVVDKYEKLLCDFESIQIVSPINISIHKNLGIAYHKLNKHDKAIIYFKKSLEFTKLMGNYKSDALNILSNLGIIYFKTGENLKANECLEQIQQIINSKTKLTTIDQANVIENMGILGVIKNHTIEGLKKIIKAYNLKQNDNMCTVDDLSITLRKLSVASKLLGFMELSSQCEKSLEGLLQGTIKMDELISTKTILEYIEKYLELLHRIESDTESRDSTGNIFLEEITSTSVISKNDHTDCELSGNVDTM